MEKNSTSNMEFCANGCGFYSNPMFNNMCSKCFKDLQVNDSVSLQVEEKSTTVPISASTEKFLELTSPSKVEKLQEPAPIAIHEEPTEPTKKQANPGRCFSCRGKVPLAKQTINKCRCTFVFCDSHRFPDKHDCEVDVVKHDKDVLTRLNPRLHDKPRVGNGFTRID